MDFQKALKNLELIKLTNIFDLRSQYKKLAKKYHPDISSEQNAEEIFKSINLAYNFLLDNFIQDSNDFTYNSIILKDLWYDIIIKDSFIYKNKTRFNFNNILFNIFKPEKKDFKRFKSYKNNLIVYDGNNFVYIINLNNLSIKKIITIKTRIIEFYIVGDEILIQTYHLIEGIRQKIFLIYSLNDYLLKNKYEFEKNEFKYFLYNNLIYIPLNFDFGLSLNRMKFKILNLFNKLDEKQVSKNKQIVDIKNNFKGFNYSDAIDDKKLYKQILRPGLTKLINKCGAFDTYKFGKIEVSSYALINCPFFNNKYFLYNYDRKNNKLLLLKINSKLDILDSFNMNLILDIHEEDTWSMTSSENYLIFLFRDNINKKFKVFIYDENFNNYYIGEFKTRILKVDIINNILIISSKYLYFIKLTTIDDINKLLIKFNK